MSFNLQTQANINSVIGTDNLIVPIGENLTNPATDTKVPYPGALSYNLTDKFLYLGDGTVWTRVGAGFTGSSGSTGTAGSTGYTGQPGLASTTGATGTGGTVGATGTAGSVGATGASGTAGTSVGVAEYNYTTQSPNNSVPPGTAFTISNQVMNNIPVAVVASAGAGGTVFTLASGTYVIDFEMSLTSAGSIGLYTGPAAGSLSLDVTTAAGSSTATTWIHGRAIEVITAGVNNVVAVSSIIGTAAVTTAGTDAGSYMVRITFMKVL